MIPHQFLPVWPEWNHRWAVMLFSAMVTLLFAPKVLSVLLLWLRGAREFGGALRLALSALAEMLYSMLLAPVRMLFHSRFVMAAVGGWEIKWTSPPRDNAETSWGYALRQHGWHTLFGVAWRAGVYWLNKDFLWRLLPVVGALVLSTHFRLVEPCFARLPAASPADFPDSRRIRAAVRVALPAPATEETSRRRWLCRRGGRPFCSMPSCAPSTAPERGGAK